MAYYLSPFTGTGTRQDPFRPVGMAPGVSYVDLRPNGAVVTGRAICYAPTLPVSGLIDDLGEELDTPSPALVTLFNSRLGITLIDATTLRDIFIELFAVWAGGSRWKPLTAGTARWPELYLGGVSLGTVMPPMAGMTTRTETWTKADGTNISADLNWTEVNGTALAVDTNKLRYTGGISGDYSMARAEHQIGTENHQIQATLIGRSWSSVSYLSGTILGRKDTSATLTFYRLEANINEGQYNLAKNIAGAATTLLATGVTPTDGDVMQLQMNGSTIGWARNGGAYTTTSDTAIPTGLYGGVEGYSGTNTGDWIEWDTWSSRPIADVRGRSPLRPRAFAPGLAR
jgi:hypothetical protein